MPAPTFLTDVLPKLPTICNGIKLLGVAETNPLIRCEDVYKLRYVRPDRPIGSSEIWEDRTTLRMTVFGKLVSDELKMTNCRFETACFIPGIQDKDAIGTQAAKGVLELHDIANLTAKPFLQRKASGTYHLTAYYKTTNIFLELIMLIAEIAIAKRSKSLEVQRLKDDCHTRMGGSCKTTDQQQLMPMLPDSELTSKGDLKRPLNRVSSANFLKHY